MYMASRMAAGALIVMLVETLSSGISWKRVSISSSEEIATPTLPTSPQRHGVIRVVADLRGQVKGHRKAGLSLLEQVAVALVGFFGRGIAGILAHGPEAAAVHGGLHAAGEGIFAGEAQLLHVIRARVLGRQDRGKRDARRGAKILCLRSGKRLSTGLRVCSSQRFCSLSKLIMAPRVIRRMCAVGIDRIRQSITQLKSIGIESFVHPFRDIFHDLSKPLHPKFGWIIGLKL